MSNTKTLNHDTLSALKERKTALNLETQRVIESEVNDLVKKYVDWYENEFEARVEVGHEEAQATNSKGELLYEHSKEWGRLTEAEWASKGYAIEECTPYHKPIYEDIVKEYDELSDYEKARVEAYKRIAEFLANLDITKI